ncbi:1,4-dihydroxy-6-naphthoate synthase [Deferribacter abyssi]|uniref:1,4-dihydroxy-6-naphthoate synthase n=1 Tax=Deferribacter abyssi TaxID=213806 RepID=UPI003C286C7F
MKKLALGISTCPNDTYIFGALINRLIDTPYEFKVVLDDVEVLNNIAINNFLDIIKVSYGVIPKLIDKYVILKSGGALSYGYGPILVSKNFKKIDELKGKSIAIPGFNTTAYNLFKYFYGDDFNFFHLRFDRIIPAIIKGDADAGLLIHEGRFVYKTFGLNLICDLGVIWDEKFNAPIPLGAIVLKRELIELTPEINSLIRKSLDYAKNNFFEIKPFVEKYAQELNEIILRKHIDAFVNDNSYDLSKYINQLSTFLNIDQSCFV